MALARLATMIAVCLSLAANGWATTPFDADAMTDCCPDTPAAMSSDDGSAPPVRHAIDCCHAAACHCAVAHGLVAVLPARGAAAPCVRIVAAGRAPTIDGHAPPVPDPLIRPPIG